MTSLWQKTLTKLSTNLDQPLNQPSNIFLDITPNCILKCRHCDIWKNPPEKQLSYKEAKIIIDKLHSWLGKYYVFFTGGEPLMNPNIFKIIKYASSMGIKSHINTNAFLITPQMIDDIIDSQVEALSISLDGSNAKTHDYLRGIKGSYHQVLKTIRTIKKISPNLPRIYTNTVIMKANCDELNDIIKLTQQEKVDEINFQCLVPNFNSNNYDQKPKDNPLWPSQSQIATIPNNFYKKYYFNPNAINHLQCSAGINNFIIDHHGDVRLCFNFSPIGNIFKTDPQKIWHSSAAKLQRQKIRQCQRSCKVLLCNLPI